MPAERLKSLGGAQHHRSPSHWRELALWALRRRRLWRVSGTSMEPEFADGDLVLLEPLRNGTPRVDDVVVARHPFKNLDVIKRVSAVDSDGYVELRSPSGDDSRQFGRASMSTVRGRVRFNLTGARRRR